MTNDFTVVELLQNKIAEVSHNVSRGLENGEKSEIVQNFMPILSKLADGLFEVSHNVSRVLENGANSEIGQND
jgi:hypothetical protein